jgi:hypothetical protein
VPDTLGAPGVDGGVVSGAGLNETKMLRSPKCDPLHVLELLPSQAPDHESTSYPPAGVAWNE